LHGSFGKRNGEGEGGGAGEKPLASLVCCDRWVLWLNDDGMISNLKWERGSETGSRHPRERMGWPARSCRIQTWNKSETKKKSKIINKIKIRK
jgi:hypothetical protein